MTIAQFIVAYAVCWWLVLFMVLPHGVAPEEKPGPGHAPSAPANPRLRRKFLITTVLAIIPTLLIYIISSQARAEDSILHAKSNDCPTVVAVAPMPNMGNISEASKGVSATISSTSTMQFESFRVPVRIPVDKYMNSDKYNIDNTETFIGSADLSVAHDGALKINGRSDFNLPSDGCPR